MPTDAGGGALVDLGCHPLYLTRLFLGGMPESVSAEYGRVTGHAVDDNAVAVLRHRSGALGIAETGFVNPASPFTIEIHGTTGSLLYGTPEPRLMVRLASGRADGEWNEVPVAPRRADAVRAMAGPYRRRHACDRERRPRARSHHTRRRRGSVGALGSGDRHRATADRRRDGGIGMVEGTRIRVGMIGAGGIARPHVDGYLRVADAAQVTAVADIDARSRRSPRRARRRRAGLRATIARCSARASSTPWTSACPTISTPTRSSPPPRPASTCSARSRCA